MVEVNKIVIKLLLSKVRSPIDVLFPTHNQVIEAGNCFKSVKAPENVISSKYITCFHL